MQAAGKAYLLDLVAYLGEAARLLLGRPILLPAAILLLALTASNAAALLYPPVEGSAVFFPILLVRAAALFVCSVAILRLAARSRRQAWTPDGGFLLFLLIVTLLGVLPALLKLLLGDIHALRTILLASALDVLVVSVCAPWLVAAAVERPLAWRGPDWLRSFDRWLPHRLLWALLLIIPLAVAQQLMPAVLFPGSAWFWPSTVAYSLFGFAALMIRLGLDIAAYRRVAQD